MTHILRTFALPAAAILVFAGCAEQPRRAEPDDAPARAADARYRETSFGAIPGWQSAALAPGLRTFGAGCRRIEQSSPLRRACDSLSPAAQGDEQAARQFIETSFSAWAIISGEGSADGLITGYYEPVVPGSRSRSDRFRHPVYGVPDDLVAVDLE